MIQCLVVLLLKILDYGGKMTIITRFAPSPTGSMHLGNARTALFNYLFAKHCGGKMYLRIEDTDKERSTEESINSIYSDLDWLGITWDGPVMLQSERIEEHKKIVDTLLKNNKAYKCYCTIEELEEMKKEAIKNKLPPKYNRIWRDKISGPTEEGKPYVVRIKAPLEGTYVINDAIKGKVEIDCSELDDMILLRSDGSPVYQLAVVVDDYHMGVNYVIRGDDHFTNSFRQKMIYEAMGWETPIFAHLPMILGTDGKKLSKRHGSCSVEDIRNDGILSPALCNYMLRLGFSTGEEIISRDDSISIFDITKINSSPAKFDSKKLENMNGFYMRKTPDAELTELIKPILISKGFDMDEWYYRVEELMYALKERSSNLNHLVDSSLFLDEKYFLTTTECGKYYTYKFSDEAKKFMSKNKDIMEAVLSEFIDREEDWYTAESDSISALMKEIADEYDTKLKIVGQSLRIALTFSTMSPPISDIISVLGPEDSLKRIEITRENIQDNHNK